MDKKRIEIIATVVLVVIFIFALVNGIKTVKQKTKPAQTASLARLPARSAVSPAAEAALPKKQIMDEELDWQRCPFSGKTYTPSGKSPSQLKASGILWDEKMPQALINDTIVRKGDSVGSCVVVKINKDSVILNDGTKDIELIVGQ